MASRSKVLVESLGEKMFVRIQKSFERKDALAAEVAGARLGSLIFKFDRKHRERTLSNLNLAFPEWSDEARLQTSRRVFEHFGRVAGDFLRSPARTMDEVLASMEVEGMENFEEAEARGKGVLAVTAHLGNWERFAHWVTASGRHISVVARDANQKGIQQRVQEIRDKTGVQVLSRGDSARALLKKLRAGEVVGLLPDQNSDECFVPYFGKPCGTVLGPAVLHIRTGAPLLPAFCVQTAPGKYRIVVKPAIDLNHEEKDETVLTARINEVLESVVREYPDQWLWMHDRWKSARRKGLL